MLLDNASKHFVAGEALQASPPSAKDVIVDKSNAKIWSFHHDYVLVDRECADFDRFVITRLSFL